MAFQIVSEETRVNKKYNLNRRSVSFRLNKIPDEIDDPVEFVMQGVKKVVDYIIQDLGSEDKVGFQFTSEGFTKGSAYLSFRKASQVTFEDIWNLLGQIYQSNSEAFHSESFRIVMTQSKSFRGGKRQRKEFYSTFDEDCKQRKGIVTIDNKDNLCLARAIVVGRAYELKDPFLKQIRQNIAKRQDQEVQRLLSAAGVVMPENGASIEELKQFQNYLTDFKITVYKYGTKGRDLLFEGPESAKKINLLYHKNHYNVITSLTSAFACSYYCQICHSPYDHRDQHRCEGSCPFCKQSPPCEKTRDEMVCPDCNRPFRGLDCYNSHKVPKSHGKASICEYVKRCLVCFRTYKADRNHVCNEIFCNNCKKHQPEGHLCYIQPNHNKPPAEGFLFIFYDLETRQDVEGPNKEKIHIPNLCVLQQRCFVCVADADLSPCTKCGQKEQIFEEPDVINKFVSYFLEKRKLFKRVIIIAHNGKAFDHHFVLKYILEKTDLQAKVIMNGTNLIKITIDNIKFLDSLNFFPLPLSELPKAFDLGTEFKKGYFPYLFNTLENSNYVGPLPAIDYYDPGNMKEGPLPNKDQRSEFLEWYSENKDQIFDMQKELIAYCRSDVDILRKACLKVRDMFLRETQVCPFLEATTIASTCNLVFRRNFLESNTIGLIPRRGYRKVDTQSKIATIWLIYEEQQRGINIRHSAKQREFIVDGIRVDGFCEATGQVFQFHGCYYHGHICFTSKRDEPLHEDPSYTLNTKYEKTLATTKRLREKGFEVIEMWECQFTHQLSKNKRAELEQHPLVAYAPLDPRDAFYGGRTGNTKIYYECKPGEKIKYVDICSLYPFVCKNGKFPVNHPEVYVGEECNKFDLSKIDGLIKCKILPVNTNLYHPVLPMKGNNKLMFVLCRTCGLELSQQDCHHSEDERALVGTWVMDEVNKALEKGYKILEIYEIWKYNVKQYNRAKNSEGLFTAMMNKFVKTKQQASGWPEDVETEEQKNAYVEMFLEREGIKLDISEIEKNEGLRSLAKLILNSFWGKFGQRENQPKTAIIRHLLEYYNILNDPAIDVKWIEEVTDDTLIMNYTHKNEAADTLSIVNVSIAAFTTAQARLQLYSYLETLGDRVIYYDTDSVVYISREGEYDIPTGNFLGDMKDELEDYGPGSYIQAFASGGPKNYSFVVFSPKYHTYFSVCKVKGIRLNHNVFQKLNFSSMTEIVNSEDQEAEAVQISSRNIRRSNNHQVVTKEEKKIYRPCCEKRKFTDGDSVPYGYKKSRSEI